MARWTTPTDYHRLRPSNLIHEHRQLREDLGMCDYFGVSYKRGTFWIDRTGWACPYSRAEFEAQTAGLYRQALARPYGGRSSHAGNAVS